MEINVTMQGILEQGWSLLLGLLHTTAICWVHAREHLKGFVGFHKIGIIKFDLCHISYTLNHYTYLMIVANHY